MFLRKNTETNLYRIPFAIDSLNLNAVGAARSGRLEKYIKVFSVKYGKDSQTEAWHSYSGKGEHARWRTVSGQVMMPKARDVEKTLSWWLPIKHASR